MSTCRLKDKPSTPRPNITPQPTHKIAQPVPVPRDTVLEMTATEYRAFRKQVEGNKKFDRQGANSMDQIIHGGKTIQIKENTMQGTNAPGTNESKFIPFSDVQLRVRGILEDTYNVLYNLEIKLGINPPSDIVGEDMKIGEINTLMLNNADSLKQCIHKLGKVYTYVVGSVPRAEEPEETSPDTNLLRRNQMLYESACSFQCECEGLIASWISEGSGCDAKAESPRMTSIDTAQGTANVLDISLKLLTEFSVNIGEVS